jgi:hypothetical protein
MTFLRLPLWIGLASTFLASCVSVSADRASAAEATLQQAVERCGAQARATDPTLELHTVGQHVSVGTKVLGIAVVLPEAPALEACIRTIPERGARIEIPEADPASEGVGGFAIDVGMGPRPRLSPEQFVALREKVHAELVRVVKSLVARGLMKPDGMAREILEGPRHP